MNIVNYTRKPIRWLANRSFIIKILGTYLVCGLIPMLVMMIYYYQNTTELLKERAYQDLRQDVTLVSNSLSSTFQPYETILESLKNDKDLNTLLSLDYSGISYSDLANYTNHTLDKLVALYPNVSRVRFFSNNTTLPQGYYFFSIDEISEKTKEELENASSSILAISDYMREGKPEVLLISKMNYYSSNTMKHYITLGIPTDGLQEMVHQEAKNRRAYLIDEQGNVLGSTREEEVLQTFADILPKWEEVSAGKIVEVANSDNHMFLCMKQNLDMGMKLVVLEDEEIIFKEARRAPIRMLFLVTILTVLLSVPVLLYSRHMDNQLQTILKATEKIGAGDFDWEITSETTDELGQITRAVDHMKHQIDELIRDNYQKQIDLKISDLNLLQEQINPHFLYNALAVISSTALRERAKETITCIRYLADFYRLSLNKGRQFIFVSEEIDLLKSYMKIQKIRFSDILAISYQIDPSIMEYKTIKLLLQPLVENAIHHAREEETFLNICVSGYKAGDRLCFEVEDDGTGMDEQALAKLQKELLRQEDGFGLKNVDKRIKLNYGQEYGVSVYSELGKGTRIHFEIPAVRVNDEKE